MMSIAGLVNTPCSALFAISELIQMCILSLFYNNRHIADRKLDYLDLKGFRILTDDLGLSINSLVSINIKVGSNHLVKSSTRLSAIISEKGKYTLSASFESMCDSRQEIIEQYINRNELYK